jgi:anthranilate phosphoribosyltransferase
VNISIAPESFVRVLDEMGIVFLFAPDLHPAMKQIQRVRREIKVKSIFNILGPLTNPAQPSGQVVGVHSEQLAATLASALMKIGASRAMVVHGSDGLDEITVTGPTTILEIRNDWMRRYHISPEHLGFKRSPASALAGGDALENSRIVRSILSGERSPRRDIVLMNAAAGLVVAGKADSIVEALPLAEESVDSGRALRKLDDLVQVSCQL